LAVNVLFQSSLPAGETVSICTIV